MDLLADPLCPARRVVRVCALLTAGSVFASSWRSYRHLAIRATPNGTHAAHSMALCYGMRPAPLLIVPTRPFRTCLSNINRNYLRHKTCRLGAGPCPSCQFSMPTIAVGRLCFLFGRQSRGAVPQPVPAKTQPGMRNSIAGRTVGNLAGDLIGSTALTRRLPAAGWRLVNAVLANAGIQFRSGLDPAHRHFSAKSLGNECRLYLGGPVATNPHRSRSDDLLAFVSENIYYLT